MASVLSSKEKGGGGGSWPQWPQSWWICRGFQGTQPWNEGWLLICCHWGRIADLQLQGQERTARGRADKKLKIQKVFKRKIHSKVGNNMGWPSKSCPTPVEGGGCLTLGMNSSKGKLGTLSLKTKIFHSPRSSSPNPRGYSKAAQDSISLWTGIYWEHHRGSGNPFGIAPFQD